MEILKRIDPEEMEKIKQLENRARSLHLPSQGLATFSLEILDNNGKIKTIYEDRSRSWVRNMYNLLVNQMITVGGTAPWNTYEYGGLSFKLKNASLNSEIFKIVNIGANIPMCSPAGNTDYGITIGTSDAAESFESYNLDSTIAHGTGEGQMEYGGSNFNYTWDAENKRFKSVLVRNIANNSGNSIGVNELGLIGGFRYDDSSSTTYLLLARDALVSTVTVAHEEQIRVTYNIYGPAYP